MASIHTVAPADTEPHGWVADACGHELHPGDTAVALTVSGEYGDDPYGLDPARSDYDLSSGHVLSDWVCGPCFLSRGQVRAA